MCVCVRIKTIWFMRSCLYQHSLSLSHFMLWYTLLAYSWFYIAILHGNVTGFMKFGYFSE